MIFNSTSSDLNLNTGVLSKAVLQAAGPSIQSEVSQQTPAGLVGWRTMCRQFCRESSLSMYFPCGFMPVG